MPAEFSYFGSLWPQCHVWEGDLYKYPWQYIWQYNAWGACVVHTVVCTYSATVCIQVCMLYLQYGAFSGWAWPGEYVTGDMCSAIHCQSVGFVKVATASGWH